MLAFAVAVALAGVAGIGLAPLLARKQALPSLGIAFATGTLLSMILIHVVPEAMELSGGGAPLMLVVGFAGMMLLHQRGLQADPCCGHEHIRHAGLPSFVAMCLCSINDGIVLYSDVDRGFASPLLWAMCVHKATAAFALFVLLKAVGAWRTRWVAAAYMVGFLAVTPASLLLASQLAQFTAIWGYALALSAGALLYVVAGSLVPRVEHLARQGAAPVLTTFFVAVLVNVGAQMLAPHDSSAHSHGPESADHDDEPTPRR